ncbi:MAG: hypothetical protein ABFD83_06915 [Armatimonadota bacterium]
MRLHLLIISLFLLLSNQAFAAQVGETSVVLYNRPHFSVEVPSSSEKHALIPTVDEEVHDVYIADGCAYVIRVIKVSDDLPASTAIEKIIQEQIKSSSKLGSINRWEMDSRDKVLFKGCTRSVDVNEAFLNSLFGGSRCVECVAMAALGDEFSPIVSVGVIGRADQSDDIESLAKYLAFTVSIIPDKPALSASPGKHILRPAPNLRSATSRPGYSSKSKPVAPTVQKPRKLKKGEIELAGTVESLSMDSKSLVMQVSQITMPGSKPIKLDPQRSKAVLYKKLPLGIAAGSRIVVIGKNEGIGKPIRAGILAIH